MLISTEWQCEEVIHRYLKATLRYFINNKTKSIFNFTTVIMCKLFNKYNTNTTNKPSLNLTCIEVSNLNKISGVLLECSLAWWPYIVLISGLLYLQYPHWYKQTWWCLTQWADIFVFCTRIVQFSWPQVMNELGSWRSIRCRLNSFS